MPSAYILNDVVLFIPEENCLRPLGARGKEVVLHAPASRLLEHLLKHSGKIVSYDDLMHSVWESKGQIVTVNTLYQNISLLRKGLKKAGLVLPVIRTHPKAGISYRGQVEPGDEIIQVPDREVMSDTDLSSVELPSPTASTVNDDDSDHSFISNQMSSSTVSPASGRFWSRQIPRSIYALIMLIVIVAVVLISFRSDKSTFSVAHIIAAHVNHCPVYVNKENSNKNIGPLIEFIRDSGIECKPGEYLYLARNMNHEEMLIFRCSRQKNGEHQCVTAMRLPL
ncbi:winged helix-turn-helix domain-containing protein [Enterobacter bugandensis]|nr:winged helix-turn-helix domain-containing protein [Enterobacter bugandensis]MDO2431844.1 winged helix-turn-helix domain-containing protein [Enterobacter bugandensis]MDO2444696.1 winged helix-turn-helix domain-containing protein [Enterobacter bugandensis]